MIVSYSDKYDILTTMYSISAREYFEILRLAILHVDGAWEDTSYKIMKYKKSDKVYECAIRILNTLHKENTAGTIEQLDSLCRRLQDDYNGNKEFEQHEEDRLAVYHAVEMLSKD